MIRFTQRVKRFLISEEGPTAVEYAVMLALIIAVCLLAVQSVGTNTSAAFSEVSTQISSTT